METKLDSCRYLLASRLIFVHLADSPLKRSTTVLPLSFHLPSNHRNPKAPDLKGRRSWRLNPRNPLTNQFRNFLVFCVVCSLLLRFYLISILFACLIIVYHPSHTSPIPFPSICIQPHCPHVTCPRLSSCLPLSHSRHDFSIIHVFSDISHNR